VLGLGKLAINELNFFSDLDLVFIAKETNAETEQVVRQLIDLLGKHTADGIAYEVDTRLRPGGRTAPLLATADGLIKYFEHDADVWEFLAMTRACHVAGDENLSQQIFEGVGSAYNRFAGKFEATMDGEAGFVSSEVAKMRGRLEASVAKLPKWAKHSIKRGRGGIVDLEFARQYWAMRQVAEERLKLSHDQAAVLKAMESFIAENFKTSAENAKDSREDSNRANSKWEDNYCWLRQLEFTQRLLRGDDKDYLPQKAERLLPLTYALDQGYSSESLLEKAEAILRENRELFEQVLGITKNE
jgi:glutamate-ammonia-ligase adenylyltransferase